MNYPSIITNESITIFAAGLPRTIRSGHRNFQRVRRALLDGNGELALQLMDFVEAVRKASNGEFSIVNGIIHFGGFILNDVLSKKLVSVVLDGGFNTDPIKNYIARILKNPSRVSTQELYDFLGYRELPITPEGMVLAWKGVNNDNWSISGNSNTKVLQGKVDERGRILNEIGATIEVHRLSVDDNRANECSYGLHVGSYAYASGFGPKLLLVEFDPADAVSVPADCQYQKLRVCKYRVLADRTGSGEIVAPVVDPKKEIKSNGRIEVETSDGVIKEALADKYNLFNTKDFDAVVSMVTKRTGLSVSDAVDAVAEYRKSIVVSKVKAYLRSGFRTVRQIHSALRIKGLTAEQVYDIVSNNRAFHVYHGGGCKGNVIVELWD